MQEMPKKLIKKTKEHFNSIIKTEKTPHHIAIGFAIGTFIGIIPTPGISVILAFLVILIYPKVNKIAIFGALAVWNPFVTIALYPPSYRIGNLLFKDAPLIKFETVIVDQIYNFSMRFLVGNLILALAISAISYLIVRIVVQLFQKKKKLMVKT